MFVWCKRSATVGRISILTFWCVVFCCCCCGGVSYIVIWSFWLRVLKSQSAVHTLRLWGAANQKTDGLKNGWLKRRWTKPACFSSCTWLNHCGLCSAVSHAKLQSTSHLTELGNFDIIFTYSASFSSFFLHTEDSYDDYQPWMEKTCRRQW